MHPAIPMAIVSLALVTLRGVGGVFVLVQAASTQQEACGASLIPWLVGMVVLDLVRIPLRVVALLNARRSVASPRTDSVAALRWDCSSSSLPEVAVASALRTHTTSLLDLCFTIISSVWHVLGLVWLSGELEHCVPPLDVTIFAAVCITLSVARCSVAALSSAVLCLCSTCPRPPPAAHVQEEWVTELQADWTGLALDSFGLSMFGAPLGSLPRTRAPGLSQAALKGLSTARSMPSGEAVRCTICLQPFEAEDLRRVMHPCGHSLFHQECADPWLSQTANCPICRTVVEPPASSTIAQDPECGAMSHEDGDDLC
jgi:hypothetical protein